jgi:putative FmdB family regulatory protein
MPIYEYNCRKCSAHVEVLQKVSDKPLTKCRRCGGKLEKAWSQTSFQLKGEGWYVTDYKKSAKSTSKEDKKESKDTKAETKADKDTKTETKTDKTPAAASSSTTASSGD